MAGPCFNLTGLGMTLQKPVDLEKPTENDEGYSLIELASSLPKYKEIAVDFNNAGLKVLKIEQLDSCLLWQKYMAEKQIIRTRKPQDPNFQMNEKYLYHGTTAKKEVICSEGLDSRLSRSSRCRFGQGIYFSDNPRKCAKYAEKEISTQFIVLARVILGCSKVYPQGESDRLLKREPEKKPSSKGWRYYDSVVGCPKDFKEFVIYRNDKALIECIITYENASPSIPITSSLTSSISATKSFKPVDRRVSKIPVVDDDTDSDTSDEDVKAESPNTSDEDVKAESPNTNVQDVKAESPYTSDEDVKAESPYTSGEDVKAESPNTSDEDEDEALKGYSSDSSLEPNDGDRMPPLSHKKYSSMEPNDGDRKPPLRHNKYSSMEPNHGDQMPPLRHKNESSPASTMPWRRSEKRGEDILADKKKEFRHRTGEIRQHVIESFLSTTGLDVDKAVHLFFNKDKKKMEKEREEQMRHEMKQKEEPSGKEKDIYEDAVCGFVTPASEPDKWKQLGTEDKEAIIDALTDNFMIVIGLEDSAENRQLSRKVLFSCDCDLDSSIVAYYESL